MPENPHTILALLGFLSGMSVLYCVGMTYRAHHAAARSERWANLAWQSVRDLLDSRTNAPGSAAEQSSPSDTEAKYYEHNGLLWSLRCPPSDHCAGIVTSAWFTSQADAESWYREHAETHTR